MSEKRQNAIPYYTKERCLKSAIAELIDDYEALKREINELREHNKYLESRVSEESDYASLPTRHNALREAVAWEREVEWLNDLITEQYACVSEIAPEEEEISVSYFEARSEVDRLIGEAEG